MKTHDKEIRRIIINDCPNYQPKGVEYYFAETEGGQELRTEAYNHYCITYNGTCPLITVLSNKDADIAEFMKYNKDICSRFTNCILPAYPALADYLGFEDKHNKKGSTKKCEICGKTFIGQGRAKYCSEKCKNKAIKKQKAEYQQKYRGR